MADQADIFQTVPVSGISRRSVIGGIAGLTLMPGQSGAQQAENAGHQDIGMKIRIVLEDRTLTGTLVDTPTARDFAALLPLTLTLTDYAATEKISDLPRKLSRESAPRGSIRSPVTLPITRPGAISRSSTRLSDIPGTDQPRRHRHRRRNIHATGIDAGHD